MSQVSLWDRGHIWHDTTNSRGEGVESGQADHTVGVGSQVLQIPVKDCGSESAESGILVGGGQVHSKTW